MTLVLSPQEIIEVTARTKPSSQAKQLTHLGVPFKPRTDGTLVVLRIHVEHLLGAERDLKPEPRLRFGS